MYRIGSPPLLSAEREPGVAAALCAGDVARYVACGEWRERAGAYAIQGVGSALVERVDGDYFNVVGLPVAALLTALAAFGAAPFSWLPAGSLSP